MSKLGLIFDMDGTLWDSAENVAKSWDEVVNESYAGLRRITADDVKGVMGLTMDRIADILFDMLPEAERIKLLDKCCDSENDYLRMHGGILYPELRETMEALRKKYHLYIVSNCQSGYIEAFLDYYSFHDLFEDIECYGNNGLNKGENIKLIVERNHLDRAFYVGDIEGDYISSREAGIGFVHAAYGFGVIEDDVPRINALSELKEVADELFG